MPISRRVCATIVLGTVLMVVGTVVVAPPATARSGNDVGGRGNLYLLSGGGTDGGVAQTRFVYGDPDDVVYVGDWDGDLVDTPMVRRGNTFHLTNSAEGGPAEAVFSYGDAADEVYVGDWDGDRRDSVAVRRGNVFLARHALTSGAADMVFGYGDPGDEVFVGNWDGSRGSSLAVRRGNTFLVSNDLRSGAAAYSAVFGDPGDTILVGNWSAHGAHNPNQADQLAVRRGNVFYFSAELYGASIPGGMGVVFGDPTDAAFTAHTGDARNEDGVGVRR